MRFRMDKITLGLALVLSIIFGVMLAWLFSLEAMGYFVSIVVIFLLSALFAPFTGYLWNKLLDWDDSR